MDELIARLEAAAKGSRRLDAEIDRIITGRTDLVAGKHCWPPYTTSIDAAQTLVPEGRRWELVSEPERGAAWVIGQGRFTHASTPELALCIAALRAAVVSWEDEG